LFREAPQHFPTDFSGYLLNSFCICGP
jgi:hypothetical protein